MPSLKDLFKKKRTEEGSPPSDELTPDDINGLSDDEFNDYMSGVGDDYDEEIPGEVPEEEPPEDAAIEEEEILEDELPEEKKIEPAIVSDPQKPKLDRIIELAGELYAGEDDPLAMLADDIEAQLAESGGLSVDDYRSQKEAESEAKRNEERDGIIKRWNDDAANMKHIDSEFELMQAMQNDTFKDAILSGKTVYEAYAAMRDAKAAEPPKPEREPIDQNIQSSGGGTGTGSKNPADLPDKDFKKYIEKQRNL